MLGETRENTAGSGGRYLRLVFFYCLADELWCGFIEVLDLCFPMTWWPHLLGNTGVSGQKECRDSTNTNPFPMLSFLGDGLADIMILGAVWDTTVLLYKRHLIFLGKNSDLSPKFVCNNWSGWSSNNFCDESILLRLLERWCDPKETGNRQV